MKKEFTVVIGGCQITGTLIECQQVFKDYRDGNNLRSSQMLRNDGVVLRGISKKLVGHFSYNGRFWRTDVKGNRV